MHDETDPYVVVLGHGGDDVVGLRDVEWPVTLRVVLTTDLWVETLALAIRDDLSVEWTRDHDPDCECCAAVTTGGNVDTSSGGEALTAKWTAWEQHRASIYGLCRACRAPRDAVLKKQSFDVDSGGHLIETFELVCPNGCDQE